MNAAQFYTSVGHKSESMIKHLIIANKISDDIYNCKKKVLKSFLHVQTARALTP